MVVDRYPCHKNHMHCLSSIIIIIQLLFVSERKDFALPLSLHLDCRDKRDDCPSYGKSACSGKYESWATKNCAKFCGLGDCESLITTTQAGKKSKSIIVCRLDAAKCG